MQLMLPCQFGTVLLLQRSGGPETHLPANDNEHVTSLCFSLLSCKTQVDAQDASFGFYACIFKTQSWTKEAQNIYRLIKWLIACDINLNDSI